MMGLAGRVLGGLLVGIATTIAAVATGEWWALLIALFIFAVSIPLGLYYLRQRRRGEPTWW